MNEQATKEELAEVANENRKMLTSKKAQTKPATPKPKAGKAVKTKSKTKAKAAKGKNDWGHLLGSQSAQIDGFIQKALAGKKALKVEELAKATGLKKDRVSVHLRHLRDDHKVIKEYA